MKAIKTKVCFQQYILQMKKLIIISLLLVVPFLSNAQIKVLESSSKKVPAWVVATGNDYFVASATAPSIDEAKDMCINEVKKQIISSIAENIKSSTSQNMSQTTTQNGIVDYLESFNSGFETRSAILPFVNGVSMSKVEAYYYEKRADKATKEISYSYSILYPFTDAELNDLIKEFLELDAQMEATLNSQIAKLGKIASTEEIDRSIAALNSLLDYFFDDQRISKTKQTIELFKKIYTYISVELVSSEPGEMVYALLAEGNPISTSVKPTFRSNCALGVMYSNMGDGIVKVTYDSTGCLDEDNNFIEVSYRIPYAPIKKQIFPTMTSSPLRIISNGGMNIKMLQPKSVEGSAPHGDDVEVVSVDGLQIEFQLDNRSSTVAKLTSLILNINESNTTISASNLDIDIVQGVSSIYIPFDKNIDIRQSNSSEKYTSLAFTKGSLTIVNPSNGRVQTLPLVVKYRLE